MSYRMEPGQIIEYRPVEVDYQEMCSTGFIDMMRYADPQPLLVYRPWQAPQAYEQYIHTPIENALWWVQPAFGVIIGLLAIAGYLACKALL